MNFVVLVVAPVLSSRGDTSRLFGHSNTGHFPARNPAPPPDYQNPPAAPSDYQNNYPYRPAERGDADKKAGQCAISSLNFQSVPAANTKVDHFDGFIDGSHSSSIEDCMEQCCNRGQDFCQYAWIFANKCFLVGCFANSTWKCLPKTVSSFSAISIYASVSHDNVGKGNVRSHPVVIFESHSTLMDNNSIVL